MYKSDLVTGSKQLNCGCADNDPNCKCPGSGQVDGAVNVNVILDSANSFTRYLDMPTNSRNSPFNTAPVFTPTVVPQNVITPTVLQPMVNNTPAQPQNIYITLPGQTTPVPAIVKEDGTVVLPENPQTQTPEVVVGKLPQHITEKGVLTAIAPAESCKEVFYPAFN